MKLELDTCSWWSDNHGKPGIGSRPDGLHLGRGELDRVLLWDILRVGSTVLGSQRFYGQRAWA